MKLVQLRKLIREELNKQVRVSKNYGTNSPENLRNKSTSTFNPSKETSSEDTIERASLTRVFNSSKVDAAIEKGTAKLNPDQKTIFKRAYDRIISSLGLKEADEYGSGGFDTFENFIGKLLGDMRDMVKPDRSGKAPALTPRLVQEVFPIALKHVLTKMGASGMYDPNTANAIALGMQDTAMNTNFLNLYNTSVEGQNTLPRILSFLIAGTLWKMNQNISDSSEKK